MSPSTIVPFWNRLPAFATYPIRGDAAITLVGFALGLMLLGLVSGVLGIVGMLLTGMLWVGAFKYSFEILLATAHGRMDAPAVSIGVSNSLVWRYILLQILTVVLPVFVAALLGVAAGIALFVLMVLVQPAAIMGLALSESLRRALNPTLWFAVMGRVGWPYLALFGLLLVMQISAANAGALLAQVLPQFLASAVAAAFTMWSMFATFHLMGYLVYQYHDEFGFEPRALAEQARLPANRDRGLLDLASEKIQNGETAAAHDLLRTEIRSRAVTVEVHELYRRLLQQGSDRAALLEHGRSFLHLLMVEKQERKALALVRECLEQDSGFTSLEFEHMAVLAERAAFGGQSKLAIDLLLAALRQQPRHEAAADWALRAADLLLRQSGGEAQARSVLASVREHCADAGKLARINAQLAAIPA